MIMAFCFDPKTGLFKPEQSDRAPDDPLFFAETSKVFKNLESELLTLSISSSLKRFVSHPFYFTLLRRGNSFFKIISFLNFLMVNIIFIMVFICLAVSSENDSGALSCFISLVVVLAAIEVVLALMVAYLMVFFKRKENFIEEFRRFSWLDEVLTKYNYNLLESGFEWVTRFDRELFNWEIVLVKKYGRTRDQSLADEEEQANKSLELRMSTEPEKHENKTMESPYLSPPTKNQKKGKKLKREEEVLPNPVEGNIKAFSMEQISLTMPNSAPDRKISKNPIN